MQKISRANSLYLRPLGGSAPYACHDLAHHRFHIIGRKGKRVVVGDDLDGFSSAINDNLAGLALAEMFFQVGTQLGIRYPF
jgi:hypothetical protein